ncbi:MAG TPA: hypothetical protein VFT06_12160 [Flavisolibacter sp.]|nr:hypothetical protein [Flavisolibacter sp.]
MALTSWVESYFRSLKANSVFNQLTKYLVQYKRVSIPSVGTILLVQQPAQLNVADKIIEPPTVSAELREDVVVPEHQLKYLSAALQQETESISQSLTEFGSWLKKRIQGDGFEWKGIGLIRQSGQPTPISLPGQTPIPAERVVRQDAAHHVLVGDQHMTSTQITGLRETETTTKKKRSVLVLIGWIILILSILFILFILYQGKFRVGSTGSRQAPTSYLQFNPLPADVRQ